MVVGRGLARDAASTAIVTWFVADEAEDATFFPQMGARSDAPEAQAVYWRCVVDFFASSLAVNAGRRHLFFANVAPPCVDGIDIGALLARWGVEIVRRPITFRLPRGTVERWGNQFYVFDILAHFAQSDAAERVLVLDSDCLWLRPVDAMEAAIDRNGALTYELGTDEHAVDEAINGLSRAGMARFLAAAGGPASDVVPYCGGEIIAAARPDILRMVEQVGRLWDSIVRQVADAPKEEAHFLSVLYAFQGYAAGTANPFIRRMWTTFKHNNLRPADCDLTIWHLPAEKRTGFRDLFGEIAAGNVVPTDGSPILAPANYARLMGVPRRRPGKFVRDLGLKLREKLRV